MTELPDPSDPTHPAEKDYDGVLVRRHPAGPETADQQGSDHDHGHDRGHAAGPVVAEIVLNRAAAMNAVSQRMALAIRNATAELAEDRAVRAVVVSAALPENGKGHTFCAGVDLKERNTMTDAELVATRPDFRRTWSAFGDLPVPVVAAVSGYALGGGCELALSCDLIVADDGAVFGLPEVSVGVIPGGGGTQTLVRRVGSGTSTAREAALELARQIAKNSPIGVRNAKHALKVGADLPLAAGLDIEDAAWRATAFSADRAEGVRAFVEKRSPRWP